MLEVSRDVFLDEKAGRIRRIHPKRRKTPDVSGVVSSFSLPHGNGLGM